MAVTPVNAVPPDPFALNTGSWISYALLVCVNANNLERNDLMSIALSAVLSCVDIRLSALLMRSLCDVGRFACWIFDRSFTSVFHR